MGYGPSAPVPIFQHEAEFTRLLKLYRERKPRNVLEIGTYHGGTLYHWLSNAPLGAHVVSVDSYAVGVDNRHLYPEWARDGIDLTVIEGDSHDPQVIAKVRQLAPYQWLFIDADHYYEPVKQDWESYGPMVEEGGVVCFHDILEDLASHPEIEVRRLWEEIKEKHRTEEIVESERNAWGGIGIVFK